jgi:hypothetical protein
MKRANLSRQRLTALGLLGIPLLSYPLLGLAAGNWGSIPAAYLYLFGVWLGLIALAAVVSEGRAK